jgi:hypothetical protein
MKYKLVLIDNGRMITGKELKTNLEAMNFAIPDLPVLPELPPKPDPLAYWDDVRKLYDNDMHAAAYHIWLHDHFYPWQVILNSRPPASNAFAIELKNKYGLVIASYGKTGKKLNGRPVIDWFIQTIPVYTYRQCAMKLTGLQSYIKLDIDFVCFGQFN